MAFRGIFDGSVEIGQAREARAAQMEMQRRQIAAQMAMQHEQLKAQMAAQRNQLQASTSQANADRSLKAQALQADTAADNRRIGVAEGELDLRRETFDSGASVREMQQANAKMLLQQAQAEFDDAQARRVTQTAFRQSAFGAGILSAVMNSVVPTSFLEKIDQANGVASGDPGSVIAMGGSSEGAWYDVVAQDEQGNVGKKHMEVDPMSLLMIAHSVLGEKGTAEFVQMYKAKDSNNTRMNIAFDKYLQAIELQGMKNEGAKDVATLKSDTTLAVEDKKTDRAVKIQELKTQVGGALGIAPAKVNLPSAVKTLSTQLEELDADLNSARNKKKTPDPEKVARRESIAKALDNVLGMLSDDGPGETPAAAAGAPAADAAAAPAAGQLPTAEVKMDGVSLFVTVNGKTAKMPDTPENRKRLKEKYSVTNF